MEPILRVYGKAMNRTALGVVNAYLQLNPKATLAKMKKDFPDSLYEKVEGGFFNTIEPLGVFQTQEIINGLPGKGLQVCHFIKDDEVLTTGDGVKICVTSSWGRGALDRLSAHVKQFGISVEEAKEGESFKRGEYRIEELRPIPKKAAPVVEAPKKSSNLYIYIGIFVLILIIILYFMFRPAKVEPVVYVAPAPVAAKVIVADKYEEVLTFNNIYFDVNQSKIKKGSDEDLNKALSYFKKKADMKVLIVGHTDKNDNSKEDYNLKLSLDRANAVKAWLVAKGANEANITTDGKGFNEAIADNASEEGRAKNRRIEFKILK